LPKFSKVPYRTFIYHGSWQLGISAFVGVVLIIVNSTAHIFRDVPIISSADEYFTVVVGLATILVLASTVTFGFLLYFLQNIDAESVSLYGRFRDDVRSLREDLERLNQDGLVDRSYDEPLGYVEAVRLSDFPLINNWLAETMMPIVDLAPKARAMKHRSRKDRDRVTYSLRRIHYIEETAYALSINRFKSIVAPVMLSPVVKSFRASAFVVVAILLGVIHYSGEYAIFLNGLAFTLGCMTVLLFAEISFRASSYVKEYRIAVESDGDEPSDEL